ncbi:histidine phosphatase superfamily [Rhodocollybia butyracea]|uniref:Histidine phosphatase superfamily n=1 Tax=Rhodocollybia butyracea TaxID=206335 RepID=A0A9P5Q035_9AGAR|nr:histidine phosphatase superfamily [Rhodocollybia butyracea]
MFFRSSIFISFFLLAANPAQFQMLWGQYAPYAPVAAYAEPSGCLINQVHLVQRHGSRYPTKTQNKVIDDAVKKLKNAVAAKKIVGPEFEFLTKFEYAIGPDKEGQLTRIGLEESYESGRVQYSRYKHLATIPLVHTSSIKRVELSAKEWIKGFEAASVEDAKEIKIPPPNRSKRWCTHKAAKATAKTPTEAWKKDYLPHILHGAGLTEDEVHGLMSMCAFHSSIIRSSSSDSTLSPFCGIFTDDQFKDFAWQSALSKYYIGKGGIHDDNKYELSPVGFAEILYTRLLSHKESDTKFYADFSHDNEMSGIVQVLGLFPQARDLSSDVRDDSSTWKISEITRFAGRIQVERMTCKAFGNQQLVRVLVNDAVQPLAWCKANKAKNGLCKVEQFVKGPAQHA